MVHGGDWNKSFILVDGNGNELGCEWVDPHFGMFRITGEDGVLRDNEVPNGFTVRIEEARAPTP
jgi:hypothetical protein